MCISAVALSCPCLRKDIQGVSFQISVHVAFVTTGWHDSIRSAAEERKGCWMGSKARARRAERVVRIQDNKENGKL